MVGLPKRKEIVFTKKNNELFYNKKEVEDLLTIIKLENYHKKYKKNSSTTGYFTFDHIFLTNGCYYRPSTFFFSSVTSDVLDYVHFAFCYFFLTLSFKTL